MNMTGRRIAKVMVLFLMLVVVGGMIFPMILRVRASAATVQCHNNLRQLGLATHNFHDTFNRFPFATVNCPGIVPEERLSWFVDVAPFVEQWRMDFDKSKPWNCPQNLNPSCHGVETPSEDLGIIAVHLCPSNPSHSNEIPNLAHYVGISGLGENAAELDKDYPGVGVFGYDRKVKFEDITDGISTTMLVAETSWKNGPWTAGGFPTVRGLLTNGMPYFGKDGQFSALHRTGGIFSKSSNLTNIMFADGSVRSIEETIDPKTFEAMATIAGGETVDLREIEYSPNEIRQDPIHSRCLRAAH